VFDTYRWKEKARRGEMISALRSKRYTYQRCYADHDCGDQQVGEVGLDDGYHWGSGERHPGTPGIMGERLDTGKGAGV
jgi:hypothetical protein